MAISGVQIIYRLQDHVRLLVDYRTGSPPPDTFNFYWSSTSGGAYTLFLEDVINQGSSIPGIKGKILVDFVPSTIASWDNGQTNYIKLAPVTGGVVGAQEGPMEIPTKDEIGVAYDKTVIFGFNKTNQKFIPILVNDDGKLITTT